MRIGATLAFLLGSSQSGKAEPCCQTCESGKEKYFSIPEPSATNPQCGECCLDPSKYKFWKVFEPKLLKGDCASQGFTKYVSTETDGVWPLQVTNDRYVEEVIVHGRTFGETFCPDQLQAVFADMHDGDEKQITISGKSMTIKPSGNNQTWVVHSEVDQKTCSSVVGFNVPGKPNPPPIDLTATLWFSSASTGSDTAKKVEFEFTDPSGKLAKPGFPLNRWVQLGFVHGSETKSEPCPQDLQYVYQDMHDGDMKRVSIRGTSLQITPVNNKQTWTVKATVDSKSCSAIVDFNVPGKPNPPPVNLLATIIGSRSSMKKVTELEFTDPSGKLAAKDVPLNHWVEIAHASDSKDNMFI